MQSIFGMTHLLPSATKLRRLCFYICLSVILFCSQGGRQPQCMLEYHPLGAGTPPGSRPPQSRTPPGTRHPPRADPPGAATPQHMATVADGMHPTGMHSWFIKKSKQFNQSYVASADTQRKWTLMLEGNKEQLKRKWSSQEYRLGMLNSNRVNLKFHLIRSYCKYLARILSFHV